LEKYNFKAVKYNINISQKAFYSNDFHVIRQCENFKAAAFTKVTFKKTSSIKYSTHRSTIRAISRQRGEWNVVPVISILVKSLTDHTLHHIA
jgi:hypothetical protein